MSVCYRLLGWSGCVGLLFGYAGHRPPYEQRYVSSSRRCTSRCRMDSPTVPTSKALLCPGADRSSQIFATSRSGLSRVSRRVEVLALPSVGTVGMSQSVDGSFVEEVK